MYNKKAVDEFWFTFGKYMALVPGASAEKTNWINYKTGIRHLQFKLKADDKHVSLTIDLSNPDFTNQQLLFNQIKEDREMLESFTNTDWSWHPPAIAEDARITARISQQLAGVNVYLRSDWTAIISFLKPLLTGLDNFWFAQKDFYSLISRS